MPKRSRKIEVVVGIFVLVSLALLLAMVVLIGRRQNVFEKRYEITGVFKAVAGLQPGAEVHLAGINIGYIRSIGFNEANEVEVVMSISKVQQERIRDDSVACIRTMGVMGDRYIQITVGSENEPPIPSGGTIQTSEMIEWEELLEAARPTLGNIEKTMKNISELTDGVSDPDGNVGTILQNIKTLSTDAREGRGTIGALFARDDIYHKTSALLDTTQETMENLRTVTANAEEASGRLPGILENAEVGAGKFVEFSALATEAAAGVYNMVDSGRNAMKDVEMTASNLKAASEDVREVTPKMDSLIESADEGVRETRKVIDAARQSWLIRGYFEPSLPGEPIAVSGRDVAQPEVTP
jgi:phospholipid/cholesterol/gamma-HCH transport system substrate-binding protein